MKTWFREGSKLIQDDHVFCDKSLDELVRDEPWAADHAARHLGLSDHAPLIVDFEVGSIGMMNLNDQPEADEPIG